MLPITAFQFIPPGGILLLTVIFREDNKRIDGGIPCNTIQGTQFLVVSLAIRICHILGKLSGYTVHKLTARAIVSFILFSITTTTAVLVTLSNMDRIAILVVCLCVVQISLSAMSTEIDILCYDSFFFTQSYLPVASALRLTVDFLASVAASILSEVLYYKYTIVLKIHLATSVALLFTSFLFFGKD